MTSWRVFAVLALVSVIEIYLLYTNLTSSTNSKSMLPVKGQFDNGLSVFVTTLGGLHPSGRGKGNVKSASNRTVSSMSSHPYHLSASSSPPASTLSSPQNSIVSATVHKPENPPLAEARRKTTHDEPEKRPQTGVQRNTKNDNPEKLPLTDPQRNIKHSKPNKKSLTSAPKKTSSHKSEKTALTKAQRQMVIQAEKEADMFPWFINVSSRHADEVHHVVFVKIHKAGSSTLTGFFLRVSLSRELNVMLPSEGITLSVESPGLSPLLEHPKSPPFLFDVLCHHVIFDHAMIKPYFPKDTRYVAMLRHPWQQTQSAFYYFRFSYMKAAGSFDRFVRNQSAYEPKNPLISRTNNRMSIDLGLNPDRIGNSSYVIPFIRHLDSVFHLVLITERFDESMVLMKRMFRWTMKDIVYKKLRSQKRNNRKFVDLDSKLAEKFRRFQAFDFAVYEHYVKVFDQRMAKEGQDFLNELRVFVGIKNLIDRFCNSTLSSSELVIPKSSYNDQFSIQHVECKILSVLPRSVGAVARNRQFARLAPLINKGYFQDE